EIAGDGLVGHTTKALREVFNLAQKQQLLDANVKYEQFRYNVQGDPLNNFYPLLQVINIEKLLPASKQSLVELIRKQIRYLEPPGVPVPEVQTLHDMREGCGVNCIPFTKTLPLSTKIVFGEKQVQYYRLSHRFEMLGEIFDVPEFVALKTDGLTGLMRVEGVSQQLLKDVIALAQTPQWLGRVAFVFIDLNDLGATNYMSRGHTDGDKYLRSFVNVTLNTFRTNDMVFRLAGDEFLGILVDVDEHQAHSIMERLTRRVYEDPETNAIFDHERNILKSIQTELTHVPNLQSLMIALDRHSGLRSQADQIIRYSRSQNTTDQEIFDEVRSASTSFIKQTLKALQRMRPGITAGIVMIGGEHNDLDTLKSVANLEANIAKKIYKYQTSAPNEYNAAKYGHVTAADQRIYQHDPNALPRIAVPKPVPRNNSKMDRPGPH
ncbi:MAG TPA: diguanylate cyclase, partial [Pseudobdellovibrionaceae bacterium]|nr:diguanylate cyclase [Pseudobdellovibrionaceae bacterium]